MYRNIFKYFCLKYENMNGYFHKNLQDYIIFVEGRKMCQANKDFCGNINKCFFIFAVDFHQVTAKSVCLNYE